MPCEASFRTQKRYYSRNIGISSVRCCGLDAAILWTGAAFSVSVIRPLYFQFISCWRPGYTSYQLLGPADLLFTVCCANLASAAQSPCPPIDAALSPTSLASSFFPRLCCVTALVDNCSNRMCLWLLRLLSFSLLLSTRQSRFRLCARIRVRCLPPMCRSTE